MTNKKRSHDGRVSLVPAARAQIRKQFKAWVLERAREFGVSHMTVRRALRNKEPRTKPGLAHDQGINPMRGPDDTTQEDAA